MQVSASTAARISVAEISQVLKYMYEDPKRRRRPVLFIGPTGVGKTESVVDFCKENDLNLKVIHTIHLGEDVIQGLPWIDRDELLARFFPLDIWPWEERSVLLLDEFNRGTTGVLNALMNVVLGNRVGARDLPGDLMIVAAANEPGAGSQTTPMSSPMVARFLPFHVYTETDGWVAWAAKNGIHHLVIGFISQREKLLNQEDDNATRRIEACPNPRNWAKLSDLLNGNADNLSLPMATAAVGAGAASEFLTWRDFAKDLPSAKDIIEGHAEFPKDDDAADAQAAVATAVGSYVIHQVSKADSNGDGAEVVRNLFQLQIDKEWPCDPVMLTLHVMKSAIGPQVSHAVATCREWNKKHARQMIEDEREFNQSS